MDEKTIKIEAYETMKQALEEKFKVAFTPAWSKVIMNNVDAVICVLKAKENAKEREQG
ncbi:MAG: hypothetical protein II304_10580 [Bacteroidales bacterium]|nr:hypothetical protein [Bacteroidales bacterium]